MKDKDCYNSIEFIDRIEREYNAYVLAQQELAKCIKDTNHPKNQHQPSSPKLRFRKGKG